MHPAGSNPTCSKWRVGLLACLLSAFVLVVFAREPGALSDYPPESVHSGPEIPHGPESVVSEVVVDAALHLMIDGVVSMVVPSRVLTTVIATGGVIFVKQLFIRCPCCGSIVGPRLVAAGSEFPCRAPECLAHGIRFRLVDLKVRDDLRSLVIRIESVTNVPASLFNGALQFPCSMPGLASDPFFVLMSGDRMIGKTRIASESPAAFFGDEFRVDASQAGTLSLWLLDSDEGRTRPDQLGCIQFTDDLPLGEHLQFHLPGHEVVTLSIEARPS